MQALCPQCSQKIVIDDAKVPDRPFNVRCPRCQTVVRLAGKGAAASGTAATPGAAAPAPRPVPATPPPDPSDPRVAGPEAGGGQPAEETRAHLMAQLRRETSVGEGSHAPQALVALPEAAHAAAITLTLTRLGYRVDTVEDLEDGARLVEQGAHQLVATSRAAAPQGRAESPYQRIARLGPEARRRIFVVLVGDQFKTGDGTQAFLTLSDLVLHSRDAGAADQVIRATIAERRRLYQAFDEARRRVEEGGI